MVVTPSFRRLLLVGLLGVIMSACSQPAGASPARVQCMDGEEIIFDQQVDRAELLSNQHVKIWLGKDSAELDGDCRIVP